METEANSILRRAQTLQLSMCLLGMLVLVVVSGSQEPDSPDLPGNSTTNATTGLGGQESTTSNTPPATFRPSIAVIVGVLTTMFSLTFLLLIYAKHCKRNPVGVFGSSAPDDPSAAIAPHHLVFRADTGIDPAVVEALPTFSFSSLKGNKDGLECAVCLSRYDDRELLRLLPKCKHAFHVDCVDTWLGSHSTCPLCRSRVTADDLLVVDEMMLLMLSSRRRSAELPVNPNSLESQGGNGNNHNNLLGQSRRSLDIDLGSGPAFQIYIQRGEEAQESKAESRDYQLRLGHRIIVSDVILQSRWSDLVPSDVLFLSRDSQMSLFWPSTDRCQSFSSASRAEGTGGTGPSKALLMRALSLGRCDSRRLWPHHPRCMSEMSGLERFRRSGSTKSGLNTDRMRLNEETTTTTSGGGNNDKRWMGIARRTLNWLMRGQARTGVTLGPGPSNLQKPSPGPGSETV